MSNNACMMESKIDTEPALGTRLAVATSMGIILTTTALLVSECNLLVSNKRADVV